MVRIQMLCERGGQSPTEGHGRSLQRNEYSAEYGFGNLKEVQTPHQRDDADGRKQHQLGNCCSVKGKCRSCEGKRPKLRLETLKKLLIISTNLRRSYSSVCAIVISLI